MRGSTPVGRRAVITGIGVVACNGIGKEPFWDSIVQGRSGIGYLRQVDTTDLSCKIGGEVLDEHFTPTDYMDAREAKATARFVHFAVAAARLAYDDAGLGQATTDPLRMGAYIATSTAGQGNLSETAHASYLERGIRAVGRTTVIEILPHAATAHVYISLGLKGPNGTLAGGCAAALESMETARRVIASGLADVVVAGGTDSGMNEYGMAQLCRLGIFAKHDGDPTKACRPYDRRHTGLVVSEGAGIVVVESAEHALARGARVYAEIIGHGASSEAKHMVAADPSGVELSHAITSALQMARLSPTAIDYFCAHGIGNPDYDRCDTNALKLALGEHAYRIPVSSVKPVTGQPWVPGGMYQAIAACLAIERGVIPPTLNFEEPDPLCDLDYVPGAARHGRVDTVLINGHSFGGTHAALILRRFSDERPPAAVEG